MSQSSKHIENVIERWPIVIVGAGAAGLFLGSRLVSSQAVLILEKGPAAGRKLLLTGGGRCNLTHQAEVSELLTHYRPDARFLRGAMARFNPSVIREHFHALGVATVVEAGERVFPRSNKASDVRDALLKSIESKGYEIRYNSDIVKIEAAKHAAAAQTEGDTEGWILTLSDGRQILAEQLAIAAGGASYPGTGSDGKLLKQLAAIGIPIRPYQAALTDLSWAKSDNSTDFKELSGISMQGVVLQKKGKKAPSSQGDLLLTHKGLSGPAALNLSAAIDDEGSDLVLRLFPDLNPDSILDLLLTYREESPKLELAAVLSKHLPRKFAQLIVKRYHPQLAELKLADISMKQWRAVAESLHGLALPTVKKGRVISGMVSSGGILTKAINPKTMALKDFPGIYACGEIIDIDGDSGGYNLQAAFATAATLAETLSIPTRHPLGG